jgi:two-component system phosphate regulon sensor histidine kinase PhoR
MAHGDLDRRVNPRTRDEIGKCNRLLNELVRQVRGTIRELTVEKNRRNTMLASISEAVLAMDRERRLLLLNRAAEELFRCTAAEVRGKYLLEVIRNHEVEKLVKQILINGAAQSLELRLFPSSRRRFRLHGAPVFTSKERVTGVVLAIEEVTTLRHLERVKTEFVANVSHELRTPLTSIKGFVETLMDSSLEDPGLSRRFLTIINAESNRLQRLVDDLLMLSRLENRRGEVSLEHASLADAVTKVLTVLTTLAQEKKVEITTHLPAQLPPLMIGEDFLGQVLMNLIENAIKYTPTGGKAMVSAAAENGWVRVEVTDTGIGIPQESIPRLFERFYRVDKARSRELGGTGLGLAIVKHILEEYSGKITVVSALGKGSTFAFTLRCWS